MINNPITYALQQVQFAIPKDILNKIFISLMSKDIGKPVHSMIPISLDARIREAVLDARVLPDINLYGGREINIPLYGVPCERPDTFNFVYRIPKSLTGGQTITRALAVAYGEGSVYGNMRMGAAFYGGSQMLDAATGVLASQSAIPAVSTAYCHVIGENVVHIMDSTGLPSNVYLRCWVTNDEMLSHLMPTTYKPFSEMVIYAVKAYIYINAQIIMDRGFIVAGAELGRFKDVVDGYSDADANYNTFLIEKWRKINILNDQVAKARHVKIITGGGW